MKHMLIAAAAALTIAGSAHAGSWGADEQYACMHDGPQSADCQMYRRQDDMENQMRKLQDQQRCEQQQYNHPACSPF